MQWEEQAARPPGNAARHWPRVVAPIAIAVLLGALGHWRIGVVVLVLGGVVAVVTSRSPAARRMVARLFEAVSRWVGATLTFVLLGVTELLVMVPTAIVQRVLPGRGAWADDAGRWQPRPRSEGLERRGFGAEPLALAPPGPIRRVVGAAVLVAGVVGVGVLVDFTTGALVDHVRGDSRRPPTAVTAGPDPAAHPAMAESAWAAEYYDALRRRRYDFVPFLYPRLADTATAHVNVQGGVRRSYQPEAPRDLPEVWMFGGSTLWGEGQRDDHTIPSELARIAEEGGLAIRVVNRGAPGYGSWQEALLFERSLATNEVPDLAVFYDGANDTQMQREHATDDPTHFEYPAIHELITGEPIGQAAAAPVADDDQGGSFAPVWDRYVEASLVAKALRQARALVGRDRAGAAPATTGDRSGGPAQSEAPGATPNDATSTTVADSTLALYRRSRSLSQSLGEQAGVPTRYFWQPVQSPTSVSRDVGDAVGPATIDLSDLLDDTDDLVWIDDVRTNETGARLVAAELWRHLRPDIEAWYEREEARP